MPRIKVHPTPYAVIRRNGSEEGPLTVEDCKDMIGWTEEKNGNYHLKDLFGKKIRLCRSPNNRPFRRALADKYVSVHLQGKWSLNLESVVVDEYDDVLQGQHRLTGLILAEQMRLIDPAQWGTTPLTFSTLIGYGASPKPDNANTYDLGAGRSLTDVIYRHQKFGKDTSEKEQKNISKILSIALRLVWLRVGGKQISFAPHFPHTEAIEFYAQHPDILRAVKDIIQLDRGESGNDQSISLRLSLGYAAALHYLTASASSWDKSVEFWTLLATGEGLNKGPILTLREFLSSLENRDELIGAVVKAWQAWLGNRKADRKNLKLSRRKDGDRFIISEFPRIGGLDSNVDIPTRLSRHQLVLLSVMRDSNGQALGYKELISQTGLQTGTISNAIMESTRSGKPNPYSLSTLGLVSVVQHEPESGKKGISPFEFSLTEKGLKLGK